MLELVRIMLNCLVYISYYASEKDHHIKISHLQGNPQSLEKELACLQH